MEENIIKVKSIGEAIKKIDDKPVQRIIVDDPAAYTNSSYLKKQMRNKFSEETIEHRQRQRADYIARRNKGNLTTGASKRSQRRTTKMETRWKEFDLTKPKD